MHRATRNLSTDSVRVGREKGCGYWPSISSSAISSAFIVSFVFIGLELAVRTLNISVS